MTYGCIVLHSRYSTISTTEILLHWSKRVGVYSFYGPGRYSLLTRLNSDEVLGYGASVYWTVTHYTPAWHPFCLKMKAQAFDKQNLCKQIKYQFSNIKTPQKHLVDEQLYHSLRMSIFKHDATSI